MILRSRQAWAKCVLIALIGSGCATSKLESDRGAPTEAGPKANRGSQDFLTTSVTEGEPGWRRIAYTGKVVWRDSPETPISDAVVSVCEGDEVYHSTLTDGRGTFELPVDLYGTPEGGRWAPESYYVLLVRAPSGEWIKERLRGFEPEKPINIALARSRG